MKIVHLKFQFQIITITTFMSLAFLVFIQGCNFLVTTRTIAPSIEIGTQWKEIQIDPPLEVVKHLQDICIEMSNMGEWGINGFEKYSIDPDGNKIKIEIQLINTEGKSFTMNTISLGSAICFSYQSDDRDLSSESTFPRSMEFEKILIRANTNIKTGEVKWVCAIHY